jgi:hypothetical protein
MYEKIELTGDPCAVVGDHADEPIAKRRCLRSQLSIIIVGGGPPVNLREGTHVLTVK